MAFFEKYSTAIFIFLGVLAVLGLTPVGAVIGRITMLGTMGLLIWLACRLVIYPVWSEKRVRQKNALIGAGILFLGAITAFVLWADPRMPNLGTDDLDCRPSRMAATDC
jgi:hypothetical protein